MKKINALLIPAISLLVLPLIVHAQGTQSLNTSFTNIGGSIKSFTDNIVKGLITLFGAMALAAFFFGVVQYIWGLRDGNPDQHKKGKNFMIWSIVALFVMFSIWGIVHFVQTTLGINGDTNITLPQIQTDPSTRGSASPLGGPGGSTSGSVSNYQSCMTVNNDAAACSRLYPGQTDGSTSGSVSNYQSCMAVNKDATTCGALYPNH